MRKVVFTIFLIAGICIGERITYDGPREFLQFEPQLPEVMLEDGVCYKPHNFAPIDTIRNDDGSCVNKIPSPVFEMQYGFNPFLVEPMKNRRLFGKVLSFQCDGLDTDKELIPQGYKITYNKQKEPYLAAEYWYYSKGSDSKFDFKFQWSRGFLDVPGFLDAYQRLNQPLTYYYGNDAVAYVISDRYSVELEDDLILDPKFAFDAENLPLYWDFNVYNSFINTYGLAISEASDFGGSLVAYIGNNRDDTPPYTGIHLNKILPRDRLNRKIKETFNFWRRPGPHGWIHSTVPIVNALDIFDVWSSKVTKNSTTIRYGRIRPLYSILSGFHPLKGRWLRKVTEIHITYNLLKQADFLMRNQLQYPEDYRFYHQLIEQMKCLHPSESLFKTLQGFTGNKILN